MSQPRHHGAQLLDAGRTRFSLWAPDAKKVSVETSDGARLPMRAEADGWFLCEAPCGAGTLYRYLIDDEFHVPDPASRAQSGDVHGPSRVVPGWCIRRAST